jgi:hypothetical protein
VASVTAGVTLAGNAVSAAALATDAGTEIAAAVWNAARASYATSGTFGEGTYALNIKPRKNVALSNLMFMMFDSSGAAAGSLTIIPTVAKDNGIEIATVNAAVEIGSGQYRIDLTLAEMNADVVRFRAHVASGADDTVMVIYTHA